MTQLKKSTLIITLLLFISATAVSAQNVQINSTNFPCANFRNFVSMAYDSGNKGYLTPTEVESVTWMDARNRNITDLRGIEFFTNLTNLNVGMGNQISGTVDVSALTKLQSLNVESNQITAIDVSALSNLLTLRVGSNRLSTLNVQGLTRLQTLSAGSNQLSSLDVQGLTNLAELSIGSNQLTSLNVQGLPNLMSLFAGFNQLTSINLQGLTNLESLSLQDNQITSLDVQSLTNLMEIRVQNNRLIATDLTGLPRLSSFNGSNQTVPITLAGLHSSFSAFLSLNNPTTLAEGISYADGILRSTSKAIESSPFAVETGNPNFNINGIFNFEYLERLDINVIHFPCANFRTWLLEQTWGTKGYVTPAEIAGITVMDASSRQIADLTGIEYFTNLQALFADNNKLTTLNVQGLTNLRTLYVDNNQLTSLDVSALTNLEILYAYSNQLTSLNVQSLTNLVQLAVSNNRLSVLDLTGLPITFFAGSNQNVPLTLAGINNNFRVAINLNNPTQLANGITYSNGVLTSTNSAVVSSPFRVETGHSGWRLHGTFNFTYDERLDINEENFPDANFRAWLLAQSWGSKGYITTAELDEITSITAENRNIRDLRGIAFFRNLESLSVSRNQLTSIDVSALTKLTNLSVASNQLTSIDVSALTNLTSLSAFNNQFTSIDESALTNLTVLNVGQNQLTSIDVSALTKLTNLTVEFNQLTSIDVSALTSLTSLNVGHNKLTSLNVQGLTNLRTLYVDNNHLTSLNVQGLTNLRTLDVNVNHLSAINLSGLDNLTGFFGAGQTVPLTLAGMNNRFSAAIELNNPTQFSTGISYANGILTSTSRTILSSPFRVQTGRTGTNLNGTFSFEYTDAVWINAENFPCANFRNYLLAQSWGRKGYITTAELDEITSITAENRNITDLTGIEFFTQLTHLAVSNNQLSTLDVSALKNLEGLSVSNNQLKTLDVSALTHLEHLLAFNNQLSAIDVSALTNLIQLAVPNNQLSALDVSALKNLQILDVNNNQLATLNVSGLTNLTHLLVSNNQLKTLDVSGLTNLRELWVSNNQLTSLDVSGLKNLQILAVRNNQLATLDVSGLTNLTYLLVSNNQLKTLDVSGATNLRELWVSNNQLTSLDVSGLAWLTTLCVSNNQLSTLNVSGCTILYCLIAENNQLTSLDVSGLTNLELLYVGNNQLTSLDVSGLTNLELLYVSHNQLSELDVTGLPNLTTFAGNNQLTAVELQRCEIHRHYRLPIALHNPVFWHTEIRFENGVLISECNSVKEVDFQVETIGNAAFTLSGTKSLTYAYDITTDIPHIITPNPNRVPVAFYNLQGQQLGQEPSRGVFIVRFDDGSSEKRMR